MKTDEVSKSLALTQCPSGDKVSCNEALSCCAEKTVGPAGEEDDLEGQEHTLHTFTLKLSAN